MTCPKRVREKLSFVPTWGKEYEKWSAGFIKEHKWRVDRMYDHADLMQEAWLVFNYVENAYPRCNDPGHFMALFKRAMINKMHDRSCRVKRRKETAEDPVSCDIYEVLSGRIGETTNGGYLAALLNEAPEELKLIIAKLAQADFDETPNKGKLKPRENLSMQVRKLLNKNGVYNGFSHDPIKELKQLFA